MKALKIIGIVILAVLLLGVLATVFGPKEVHIQRETTINASVDAVYAEISGFKTFDQFSAWSEIDTTAEITIQGPIAGVGASYSWNSDNPDLGVGEMQIIEVDESKMVKYKMSFEGFPGEPTASWFLVEEEGRTKVTYTYDQEGISGIWKLFAYGTEGMLGPMYDRTLEKLNNRVEGRPILKSRIAVQEVSPIVFAGKEVTSANNVGEISDVMEEAYGAIMISIMKNGLTMTEEYPLAISTSYDESSISMICGIPVADGSVIEGEDVSVMNSPEGAALRALHFGDYALLEDTHNQIDQYANYYGYEITGYPWEIYVSDPSIESDTSKWITEVYYPVK
ncbi:SRPBCC family protein [Ekhidna sp.]